MATGFQLDFYLLAQKDAECPEDTSPSANHMQMSGDCGVFQIRLNTYAKATKPQSWYPVDNP